MHLSKLENLKRETGFSINHGWVLSLTGEFDFRLDSPLCWPSTEECKLRRASFSQRWWPWEHKLELHKLTFTCLSNQHTSPLSRTTIRFSESIRHRHTWILLYLFNDLSISLMSFLKTEGGWSLSPCLIHKLLEKTLCGFLCGDNQSLLPQVGYSAE